MLSVKLEVNSLANLELRQTWNGGISLALTKGDLCERTFLSLASMSSKEGLAEMISSLAIFMSTSLTSIEALEIGLPAVTSSTTHRPASIWSGRSDSSFKPRLLIVTGVSFFTPFESC
jgi:hypothetical protein